MPTKKQSPYACHMLVCVNNHHREHNSCTHGSHPSHCKSMMAHASYGRWRSQVRISRCDRAHLCADGPNVLLYPQQRWFGDDSHNDMSAVVSAVDGILHSISTN